MMNKVLKVPHTLVIALLLVIMTFSHAQDNPLNELNAAKTLLENSKTLRFQNPDSAVSLLQQAHEKFLKGGDTVMAINTLLDMPYIYGQKVDYAKSYDDLWLALFLADDIKNDKLKANVYSKLGRLYSFFKKEKKAFEYLQSGLKLKKKLVEQQSLDQGYLVEDYYLICATYRELGDLKTGEIYLDSCFLKYKTLPNQIEMAYLQFEKSFILAKKNKTNEALKILTDIEPWFQKNRPSYLVLIYTYWGDIYRNAPVDHEKSEYYYKKAIEISNTYNSHVDFSPLIHERLANLYQNKGDYRKAFLSQQTAKELDALFFDSRSTINKPLLEIKDEYRLEKERQEKLIQKQRLEQLEQEDKISFLQRIILLGALIFTLIIAAVYIMQIRSKHKIEKELIQKNKELEIQKTKEIVALKNKELATSALQLVEKDEFLKDLKSKLVALKEGSKSTEVNHILKSISLNNTNNWKEFKLRFTAVNEEFYKRIATKYPNLSQADQKICALIKLNFSSKEMAKLLGISVESVHTTRYRLRKKMKLERSVNLEDFIANL